MKVGIITFHWATNYGAVLQAYALQRFVQNAGFDVQIIDYVPNGCKLGFWRCFRARTVAAVRKNLHEYQKEKKIERFRLTYLLRTDKRYTRKEQLKNTPPQFDWYISGSDQIWNSYFTLHGEGAENLSYFLNFAPDDAKRLSYASSFGLPEIPTEAARVIRPELEKFARITVRENKGKTILKKLGFEAKVVLDPTLLLVADDYNAIAGKDAREKTDVYAFFLHDQKQIWNLLLDEIENKIGKLAEESALTGEVGEWLSCIRGAKFVVTNSFHCVAFSILFHTPFLVVDVVGQDMSDRVVTLLHATGLERHFVKNPKQQLPNLEQYLKVAWDDVDAKLLTIRQDSQNYLLDLLANRS